MSGGTRPASALVDSVCWLREAFKFVFTATIPHEKQPQTACVPFSVVVFARLLLQYRLPHL